MLEESKSNPSVEGHEPLNPGAGAPASAPGSSRSQKGSTESPLALPSLKTSKKRKARSRTKKPNSGENPTGIRYLETQQKLIKEHILEAMREGRTFNGAVAHVRDWMGDKIEVKEWGKWADPEVPTRSTLYAWMKNDPAFQEDVETARESYHGYFETIEKKVAEGGAILKEVISFYRGQKDGEEGPIKQRIIEYAPPNAPAALKGLSRQASHIMKIRKAKDADAKREAICDVPVPEQMIMDDEGNEIPLPQIVVLRVEPITPAAGSQVTSSKPGGESGQ